ncbi:hypothetical protein STEG23_037028, partial [Scotinomys teguina]
VHGCSGSIAWTTLKASKVDKFLGSKRNLALPQQDNCDDVNKDDDDHDDDNDKDTSMQCDTIMKPGNSNERPPKSSHAIRRIKK